MIKLTIQEEKVMLLIWQMKSCTVKDILSKMPNPHPPYTTMASVMVNLIRKQYVTFTRKGGAYMYTYTMDIVDYKRVLANDFIHRFFRGSFKEMVLFLAEEKRISSKELNDIVKQSLAPDEDDILT